MNYRSVSDMAMLVRERSSIIPSDIDLVVGVPRSGTLAASLVALQLNVCLTDVYGLIANLPLHHGSTRVPRCPTITHPHAARHILVIDDSLDTGCSMDAVKAKIIESGLKSRITYAACFVVPGATGKVDLYFESVPQPRAFEWNIMQKPMLEACCVDIDGVLCEDPSESENDDGIRYARFLESAKPLIRPKYPLGVLVTSRLEKYRAQTQSWLNAQGISYKKLEMLNLPDAATRRRLNAHAKFKAEVYRKYLGAPLFIESDPGQAREIARLSGKQCLCYRTQEVFEPECNFASSKIKVRRAMRDLASTVYRGVTKLLKGVR